MERINFKDGTLKAPGYVVIDEKTCVITEAEYEGETPLSAFMMNKLQDNIEDAINNIDPLPGGGGGADEVYIGEEAQAPETAKLIIDPTELTPASDISDIIDKGRVNNIIINANTYTDVTITFVKKFSKPPTICTTLFNANTVSVTYAEVTPVTKSVTVTSAVVRIFNKSSESKALALDWIAVS